MPAPDAVTRAVDANFENSVAQLETLARIPSVSASGFDPAEVVRSADAVAQLLEATGLTGVEVLRPGDAHPYVVAQWAGASEDAPRVLLYSHHDVQPPGRLDQWRSPPFEPMRGADGRLYGRGVVDDKAGIVAHIAAITAWLETEGRLPVDLKIVVEGEEEIGSSHLRDFLLRYRERLDADVIVLSDTANLETGTPSLTTSLRGLVVVDVHVRALDHPLHSGMWGGAVPDAATALTALLGRLVDAEGSPAVEGLEDDVPEPSPETRDRLAALPFDAEAFRRDAGLPASARLLGRASQSVYERLWLRPAIAINALEAMPLAGAANQLIDRASARVGLRLAPGQDAERARDHLLEALQTDPPFGVEVRCEVKAASGGWQTDARGPAFDAAHRALAAGYERAPIHIGCGGSIPFVGPFAEALGGVPALLLGLEDPVCNAHGENESLHLGDFRKSIHATAHLFAELAATLSRG
ncbi:MAG: M20/M25/M40 family metallo-hydrolase [Myxococcota bacterium]